MKIIEIEVTTKKLMKCDGILGPWYFYFISFLSNKEIKVQERNPELSAVVYFDQRLGATHTKRWSK